jgi:hypothetical protein
MSDTLGHGSFVYDPDYTLAKHGTAKKAAALVKLGMTHAWIRGHNKNGLWKVNANQKLIDVSREGYRGRRLGMVRWQRCPQRP